MDSTHLSTLSKIKRLILHEGIQALHTFRKSFILPAMPIRSFLILCVCFANQLFAQTFHASPAPLLVQELQFEQANECYIYFRAFTRRNGCGSVEGGEGLGLELRS